MTNNPKSPHDRSTLSDVLPLRQFPNLRLQRTRFNADLREDRHGLFEMCHRLFVMTRLMQPVGQIVVEGSFTILIAQRGAFG
jgi:hypothetical protein